MQPEPTIREAGRDDDIRDEEIEALLGRVYVDGGFTAREDAPAIFAGPAVRARGRLIVAREPDGGPLLGMVIEVPFEAPARRLAHPGEAELHLLAVAPEQRGRGLGAALIRAAMDAARRDGHERMVLWTQPSQTSAHHLYVAAGFTRDPDRDWALGEKRYLVYATTL